MARDTSFYYSFLVLPPEKRRAIIAVWDFCRAVDDAVDEAAGTTDGLAARELARWRSELARCFEGDVPETPQGRALQPLIDRFTLPRSAFEALIEGVEMDLSPRRYATFAELYEYCIRVASAVGLMCVEIFGYRNPTTASTRLSSEWRCSSRTSFGTFRAICLRAGCTCRSRISSGTGAAKTI